MCNEKNIAGGSFAYSQSWALNTFLYLNTKYYIHAQNVFKY